MATSRTTLCFLSFTIVSLFFFFFDCFRCCIVCFLPSPLPACFVILSSWTGGWMDGWMDVFVITGPFGFVTGHRQRNIQCLFLHPHPVLACLLDCPRYSPSAIAQKTKQRKGKIKIKIKNENWQARCWPSFFFLLHWHWLWLLMRLRRPLSDLPNQTKPNQLQPSLAQPSLPHAMDVATHPPHSAPISQRSLFPSDAHPPQLPPPSLSFSFGFSSLSLSPSRAPETQGEPQ